MPVGVKARAKPVSLAGLAHDRGQVLLDRRFRDLQFSRDLGVAQAAAEGGEHQEFPLREPGGARVGLGAVRVRCGGHGESREQGLPSGAHDDQGAGELASVYGRRHVALRAHRHDLDGLTLGLDIPQQQDVGTPRISPAGPQPLYDPSRIRAAARFPQDHCFRYKVPNAIQCRRAPIMNREYLDVGVWR